MEQQLSRYVVAFQKLSSRYNDCLEALKAIADTKVDADTEHEQLSALLIGIARVELQRQCCGNAACYNESSGLPCAAMGVQAPEAEPFPKLI